MNKNTIYRSDVRHFINNTIKSSFYGVTFVKKNGDIREMQCRQSVATYTNGKGMNYDPTTKGLLGTFDVQFANRLAREAKEKAEQEGVEYSGFEGQRAYRMINLRTLTEIRFGGKVYEVID